MAFLEGFGSYLPTRVVTNEEIGAMVGCDSEWIMNVSGIETRRFAAHGQSVADLGVSAAEDCLKRCGVEARSIGMVLVASGSSERRFPGPASEISYKLGLPDVPAIDLSMASAGSLFGLALAYQLAGGYGRILVVATEKMSTIAQCGPMERGVAILFGDGAGACLVNAERGPARILDATLCSDGEFRDDLKLEFGEPLAMNGRTVILQASRNVPRAIASLLQRNHKPATDVDVFLMHQANQNLIVRVAQALGVASERFYSNIRRYGNTSSASMLIAAAEWWENSGFRPGIPVCFAGFGAGFHWGALLAEGV